MANFSLNKSVQTAVNITSSFDSPNAVVEKATVNGIFNKVLGMFALVVGVAAFTWFAVPPAFSVLALLPAILVGLGLSLWVTFSKTVLPSVMLVYVGVQGFILGALSQFMEMRYPGIVQTAVIATLSVAGVLFIGVRAGWIKISDRAIKIFGFVALGYMVFLITQIGFSVFTGGNLYDSQYGWLIGLVGVGLAGFSLAADFSFTGRVLETYTLPKQDEWRFAFGIISSLIWLYIEILRFLGLARR